MVNGKVAKSGYIIRCPERKAIFTELHFTLLLRAKIFAFLIDPNAVLCRDDRL